MVAKRLTLLLPFFRVGSRRAWFSQCQRATKEWPLPFRGVRGRCGNREQARRREKRGAVALSLHAGMCCVMFLSSATALAQATRQVFFTAAEGSGLVGIAVSYDDTVYGALGSGGARNL